MKINFVKAVTFLVTLSALLSSCATTVGPKHNPEDPLESFNRPMFCFNDAVDKVILKPIATFYNIIMPAPLNVGISNFFRNLNTLSTIANDVLQLKFYQATNDAWRFAVNSTFGIGGLVDVATRINLESNYEDFGLTLARWGYTHSTYVVLPFFGPSTIRDAIGLPIDYYGFSVYPYIHSKELRYSLYGLSVVERRAQLLQFQGVYEAAALDKYSFVRNAYKQRRAAEIAQRENQGPGQPLDQAQVSKKALAVEEAKKVD